MPLTEFQKASMRRGLISKDQIVDPDTGEIWTPESGGLSEAEHDALDHSGVPGIGGGWTLVIDKDGTDFTDCTSESGTWASNGTSIQQTLAGASHRRMRFDTKVAIGAVVIVEAEVKIVAAGGANAGAGFLIGHPGADANGSAAVYIRPTANDVQWENQGVAAIRNVTTTIDTAIFYTLRAILAGSLMTVYVDGTLVGTARNGGSAANADYVGLGTFDATADFQAVRVWTPALP